MPNQSAQAGIPNFAQWIQNNSQTVQQITGSSGFQNYLYNTLVQGQGVIRPDDLVSFTFPAPVTKTAMNFDQAFEQTKKYLRSGLVPMLWGNPGIGKSTLGRLVAETYDLLFIDMRLTSMDPVDLNGFVHKDLETRTFDYLPWARFPLETTPLPLNPKTQQPCKGWLILVDELPNASRQHLAAAYRLFLDRMVGQEKLHPKALLMAGGNLVGQGLAGPMPSALISRLAHVHMEAALTPSLESLLGPSLSRFLRDHPKFLYKETELPNTPFPTLRTWEMVRHYIDKNGFDLDGLQGIVGTEAAVSYYSAHQHQEEVLTLLNGVEPFPMDKAQDLIDSMGVSELQKHLHRFPGEWKTIAEVRLQELLDRNATPT